MLKKAAEIQIVAEVRDGAEALHLSEKNRPDVVLMDITMPELDGLEAARVHKEFSGVPVIIPSVHAAEE